MSAPQGVLDDATSLTLSVFPAEGRSCAADGSASEIPADALTFPLSKSGCSGGATWCGEVTLDQDDAPQMFHVEVRDAAGLLAQGCTTAVVDRDPLDVGIQVVRFVEPSCCGDGTLQASELCDGGGDDSCGGTTEDIVCASDCTTRLIRIDETPGSPADIGQSALSIAFTPGEGQFDGGLRAAWNWDDLDVGLRILQPSLAPIDDPDRATLFDAHRLYFRCSGTDEVPLRVQKSPKIAPQGTGAVLAFLSQEEAPTRFDARVITLNSDGCIDQLESLIASNESATVDAIDIAAGPAGTALVVWEQSGRVFARTYADDALGAETLTIATDGSAPRVAGSSHGWAIAYQGPGGGDPDGILMTRVDASLAVSDAVLVNAATAGLQDQPDLSIVQDGSVAVVYRSGGDVFLQRFSSANAPNDEDRGGPVNTTADGDQGAPVIAAASSGDFFILAWESGNEIRARFAARATGFLFNNLTGQNDDFVATASATSPRRPAVAVGEQVAIGWDDLGAASPGVFVRRFPLPN